MKHRRLIASIGFFLGLLLILIPAYFYFTTNKTVFSSDKTVINDPQTSVSRTVLLDGKNSPYQVMLQVSFQISNPPKNADHHLFSYIASLQNSKGETVEQKSSTYKYISDMKTTGNQSDTITLFNFKTLPSDTYAISITLQPNPTKDAAITLTSFTYVVKSNVMSLSFYFPLAGLLLLVTAYFLFPRASKLNQPTPTPSVNA